MDKRAHLTIMGANEIAREGFRLLMCQRRFTVASLPLTGLAEVLEEGPDSPDHVIVIDVATVPEAIELCQQIRAARSQVRIALMVVSCPIAMAWQAFAAGASGILLRKTPCEPLAAMLDLIVMGELIVPSGFIENLGANETRMVDAADPSFAKALSERESSILRCLVGGDANKVISRKLGIAEATVKVHVKAIMRKLRVTNRTQAAIWGVSNGVVDTSHEPRLG